MPYANIKDADQLAHPCSLISGFDVRCLDIITKIAVHTKPSFRAVSEAELAGFSLTWSHTSKDISHCVAQMKYSGYKVKRCSVQAHLANFIPHC